MPRSCCSTWRKEGGPPTHFRSPSRKSFRTLPRLRPQWGGVPSSLTGVSAASKRGYEILSQLGEGGMGVVYRARDDRLKRDVALKVIRSDSMTPVMRARFEAEAQALAGPDHPHIVKVFDVGGNDHARRDGRSFPILLRCFGLRML